MNALRIRRATALLVPLALAAGLTVAGTPAHSATSTGVRTLTRAELYRIAASDRVPASHAAHETQMENADHHGEGLPTFSGSFTTDGVTYPYTMLGADPSSGRTTRLKTVIVPVRVKFVGFDAPQTFDPAFAVRNILRSPIYHNATYLNGRGQFADMFQRATFWNQMDTGKRWHTLMDTPEVTGTYTITVTPDVAQLFDFNGLLGNVNIDEFDARLHKILPKLHLKADETPLFVTQSVIADALGYHDAFLVPERRHGKDAQRTQMLMYSSWLDPDQVGTLLGDITTLNHEVAEWVDDPFINNEAPLWAFPPNNEVCGDNPFLEVGDPAGNGPDFDLFPVTEIRMRGYTYHLQELNTLQWFSREVPSSAFGGWYSFPDPTQMTTPSVPCPDVPVS